MKSTRSKKPSNLSMWLTPDRVIIGATVFVTLLVVAVIGLSSLRNNAIQNTDIEGVEFIPIISSSHQTTPVNYPQNPPVGGPHHPTWQNCGVYTSPLINEHAVHSLEHGAVWITYAPNLPAEQVQTLQNITRSSSHRLLSPYPGIDSPIVLTAWGYQLKLESADDPRLMQFIEKYEQGPTTPEPGAICTGGTSATR